MRNCSAVGAEMFRDAISSRTATAHRTAADAEANVARIPSPICLMKVPRWPATARVRSPVCSRKSSDAAVSPRRCRSSVDETMSLNSKVTVDGAGVDPPPRNVRIAARAAVLSPSHGLCSMPSSATSRAPGIAAASALEQWNGNTRLPRRCTTNVGTRISPSNGRTSMRSASMYR